MFLAKSLSNPWLKLVDETCNGSKAGINGTSDNIRVDDVDDQPLSAWINIPTGSVQYTKAITIQSSFDVSFFFKSGCICLNKKIHFILHWFM